MNKTLDIQKAQEPFPIMSAKRETLYLNLDLLPYPIFILNKDMFCVDCNQKGLDFLTLLTNRSIQYKELIKNHQPTKKTWVKFLPLKVQKEFKAFCELNKDYLNNKNSDIVKILEFKTPSFEFKINNKLTIKFSLLLGYKKIVVACEYLKEEEKTQTVNLLNSDDNIFCAYELSLTIEDDRLLQSKDITMQARIPQITLSDLYSCIHPDDAASAIFYIFHRADKQLSVDLKYQIKNNANEWTLIEDSLLDFRYNTALTPDSLYSLIRQAEIEPQARETFIECKNNLSSQVLEDTADGLFDWQIDLGKVIYSSKFRELLGYEAESFIHKDNLWRSMVHPNDIATLRKQRADCVLGINDVFQIECRARTKNNSTIWLRYKLKVIAKNRSGFALRCIGSITNINELKNNQRLLSLLYNITVAADGAKTFTELYQSIYEALPTESGMGFAIAIINESGGVNIPCSYDTDLIYGLHTCDDCTLREFITEVIQKKEQLVSAAPNRTQKETKCHVKWYYLMGTPLIVNDECIGVLIFYIHEKDHAFYDYDFNLMKMLANQIAHTIGRKKHEFNLSNLALKDPLTQLANRTLLQERVKFGIERMKRNPDYLCAILMLDLDHFKLVNDKYGHGVGDELLKSVANFLSQQVRGVDTVCRLGGDEFIIFLENIFSPAEAIHVAERILHGLKDPMTIDTYELKIGTSIGIIPDLSEYTNLDSILSDVDIALYSSKQNGRNRYEIFKNNINQTE